MENFNKWQIDLANEDTAQTKELKAYLNLINKCFDKENNNFADLCFYVYEVKQLFDRNYYYNKRSETYSFKSIMANFGLNEKETSRLCACYKKYVNTYDTGKAVIIDIFAGFSKSKLYELLTVPNEQLKIDLNNKVLREDMSVKTLREYVKNYQALQKQNKKLNETQEETQIDETVEEEIPEAYNPTKHYDFTYFETKTKSQLLNIVWQLQQEYEKLKKEKKQKNGK